MGHKKRAPPPPRSKSAAAGSDAAGAVAVVKGREEGRVAKASSVKVECERALNALRRGNYNKAVRLIKEASHRFEGSGLVFRVQGTVCVKAASVIDDPNVKQRHLRNAVESARRAVELSPNSIEFAHFYANLLYDVASEGKEYEEVAQECEKALVIENPVDPAKESLQDENQQKISTAEGRISHVQSELRSLIQKANIASISTWMKHINNGEEKFRLIPFRRAAEDPMELKLVQTKRPNEIKKATKTPEERRKEIEVRVAAARLLQQQSDSSRLRNGGENLSRMPDSTSGNGHKVSERRKHGNTRKNGSSVEHRDWVHSYWNSMNYDMKKDLLRINVFDLKTHFASSKDGLASEILSDALSYAEVNKSWKFWTCCRCGEKFSDQDYHMRHVMQQHMGSLSPKMQSVMPQNISDEWIDMILSCSWKPLDISAAVRHTENQSKRKDPEPVCRSSLDDHPYDDDFGAAWDASLNKEISDDSYSVNAYGDMNCVNYSSNDIAHCDGNQADLVTYPLTGTWPVSDGLERGKLLEKIRSLLEALIQHKYLAVSHLSKVIQFTMDEIRGLPSGSQLMGSGVDQSPECICFLGSSQLKKVLKFLQDVSYSCSLSRYSEKNSRVVDDINSGHQGVEIKDKISLSEDASLVFLNECLLSVEPSSLVSASADVSEIRNSADLDALLSWIYAGPAIGEQSTTWMRTGEEKSHQGIEILQLLDKEFCHLQGLCERKCDNLGYEEALQMVEDLCLEESKRRDNGLDIASQSYDSVLKKRQEMLIQEEKDTGIVTNRFELDAIANVIKEAESLRSNKFGYNEIYGAAASHFRDLESGIDDDSRSKDCINQMNTCTEVVIQRQKEQLSVELSKIDARIMQILSGMRELELKLERVSVYDYQNIFVPLVKSFLQAYLEDLAEKDATEKSDAVREALLAELALDSKKGISGNDARVSQTKDKKKGKDYRRVKNTKVHSAHEQPLQDNEDAELLPSPVMPKDEDSQIDDAVSGIEDDLIQQDEEIKRKIELEAEERKLEETLEYQRRIENEAKQKHLTEKHRQSVRTAPQKLSMELLDTQLKKPGYDVLPNRNQDILFQRNGAPHDIESSLVHSIDGATQAYKNTNSSSEDMLTSQGHLHGNSVKGLSNGSVPEEGVSNSDRRMGQRGKRNKNFITPEVHDEYLSLEKENTGLYASEGQTLVNVKSHDVRENEYNEAKTLRQLQAADDDEERFQADLEKAVRQSLDTYEARRKMPQVSRMPPSELSQSVESRILPNGFKAEDESQVPIFGTGLKNETGEYNCFLNVIIQSLWHIRRFRDEFLSRSSSEHVHIGDPCVVCALYDIFISLNMASMDSRREAVAPTSLRIALSNLYPDSNFFQEAQMNDASEVLGVIFDCLHQSFTSQLGVCDTKLKENSPMGSWDCLNKACIAHTIFGMNIFERMNCRSCQLESRHLKYTSFFHNINASSLRTMKVMCAESSFDELLNLVEMNHQVACDPEAGGCGKQNYIHHILSSPPHVFTTVLGWQNTWETAEDIKATLAALSTEFDVAVLYRGLDPKNKHFLVSVVCYYGQHYHCFAYSHDHQQWLMYDDQTVKVVGSWEEVLSMCERGHLQPQVLFFESVN
uniref:USP domain-containing protein n=1 Tax=Kalanchoe fedtschenkoi TaxID=63787 RepID=A0A7N0VE16_KALFE